MLRHLRRHSAFAVTLIAVLVGVAVTTAMFSVVYGVLLRDLPYPDAGRLVTLASSDPRIPQGRTVAGAADYHDWPRASRCSRTASRSSTSSPTRGWPA
jgi:putative ABC transport system permease protein